MIEKPIRKYLKQKDYQKHKILRRIKKRNQRRKEAASKIAERALRKKLKLPAFEGGKDEDELLIGGYVAPELVVTPEGNAFRTTESGQPAVSTGALLEAGIPIRRKSKELKNNQKLLGHDEYLAQQATVDEKVNKTTPSVELLFNIATIGGWNNLSPTQWMRRAYDTGQLINGNMSLDEYMNKLYFGNSGIVSDEYAREHPYRAMAANLIGDMATFGTSSALLKMPSWRRAMQAENQMAQDIAAKQNEGLAVSALPDYRGEIRTDYNLFKRFADRRIPQKTVKSVETPSNNIDLTSNILIDPDERFMMFEPGKFINHDIGAMSVEDVVNTFGPEAEHYKNLYDIAKAHNFEGKYAKIGQYAEYNILNRFAINKADPDVAKGIAEARSIYDIPEYRARFNRWGTLGDTFVDDARARIDNVKLLGRSKNLDIKGQHGVHGGAYTSPDATTIGITNSESSSWITDMIRHEANHVAHGLERQPAWVRYHNEKIRPVVREGKTVDTPLDKYYDEMDEIVERSKTAVEYANKIRKEGETLDQALTRLADMTETNIYNAEIPADIRQSIARYTKDSMLNFWKNFVGEYAAPIGVGLTGYGLYNSVTDPIISSYNRGKDPIHIKPSKRGTFTAAAKKRGMGVLLFANKVLKNPSNYSSAMRKKALFAKNATKFKH